MAATTNALEFFWDRKHRKSSRSRFNLLLLDYGEYFLEDFAVYYFPTSGSDSRQGLDLQEATKIQGRLKLCSRSLLFEPNEVRFPLVKFPFKAMVAELERFALKSHEQGALSMQVTGFFTFSCNQFLEMKVSSSQIESIGCNF
jgi:hypothetical protein